ncbi:MAG: hypothetical protein ACFFCW_17270, partial [Candidatus Hodarchaeota archaeon]
EMRQSGAGVGGLMELLPWVRLQPVSGSSPNVYVHDGKTIILAVAYIDTNLKLKILSYEDSHVQYRRQVIGQSIEELRIQRSVKVGNRVKERESAVIGPADSGGLEIRSANRIVVQDSSEREVLNFNSDAAVLNLGAKGNEGDLRIFDGSGRKVFDFNSHKAVLNLGATGNEGDISVRDNSGTESVRIDGNTGNIKLHGQLLDALSRNIGLTYSQKQDLTDGGIATIHKHDLGVIGRYGGRKTQIGIIAGWVWLRSGYIADGVKGSVTIKFSDWTHTATGDGYHDKYVTGYQGNFDGTPHAILAPTKLGLSTHTDTWFDVWMGSHSPTEISFNWEIDTSGGDNVIHFLIIGGI